MEKNKFYENFIQYVRNNQVLTAGVIAVLALVISAGVLFSHDAVGMVDYGEYTQTLYDMGLSYTEDTVKDGSLYFSKVIENYQVDSINFLKLLQLEPTQSLIYPVSLVSMVCSGLHILFSTRYLAFLLLLISVGCIYSITRSAYVFIGEKAAALGVLCCFVLLCGNYIIYFNSLYRNGVYFVSLLAFFTILLHIAAVKGKVSAKVILLLLFTSLVLLNARETNIVFLPLVVLGDIWAAFFCRPEKKRQRTYYLLFGLLLIYVVRSNIMYTMGNEALFSDTQLYHSFFDGALTESDEPGTLLEELGMDSALAEDIGKNAYLSEEEYVVAPGSEAAKEQIFTHLSYEKLWQLYQKHPGLYLKVLQTTAENVKEIDTSKFLYVNRSAEEGTEWVERFVWWQWLRRLIVPDTAAGYGVIAGLTLLLGIIWGIRNRKDRQRRAVLFLGGLIWLFAAAEFLTIYAWQGYAEMSANTYYFILPYDIFLLLLTGVGIRFVCAAKRKYGEFFREQEETEKTEADPGEEKLFLKNPLIQVLKTWIKKGFRLFQDKVLEYPGRAAFFFMIISAVIVFGVLFFPNRIGAYNNGDFGRMMTAMNIRYTAEDWKNVDELSLTKVVENYDWEENYDYSKIMPYNADLSQIWFSLPLKIIDNYVGLQFSTVYVTIMYAVLIVISMFFIVKVLFHQFGKRCLWFVAALLFILLDQVNLGWLNSLFGEGIAFVAFLMVIASALSLADMERGTGRWSFLFLFFSEILFIGAKAQFTVTVPILLIGTLLLFIYHRPQKITKCIPWFAFYLLICIWLGTSAVTIYKNNENISSPDATYQAVFYGLLMLSDDPAETLTELGLDPGMAADTGKHAFLDKSEYYCAPRTEQAEEMLYSKITTFDILFYYLKHPKLLWEVMERTAQASAENMPDFILVVGEKTTQPHETVKRFNLWGSMRSFFALNHFWEMILFYGVEIILTVRFLISKKNSRRNKLLICILLLISAIGVIQYPLTIIGNGFADNTKQLFIFRLTLDLTALTGIFLLFPFVKRRLTS